VEAQVRWFKVRRCPEAQRVGEGERRTQKDAGGDVAGSASAENHQRKKILSPTHKRKAVVLLVEEAQVDPSRKRISTPQNAALQGASAVLNQYAQQIKTA
jgi:hypothetical protein